MKSSKYPKLVWDLGGHVYEPALIPQSQVIHILSEGKMTQEMSPQERWDYVKNFGHKNQSFGFKKVIEKVKQLVPRGKEPKPSKLKE